MDKEGAAPPFPSSPPPLSPLLLIQQGREGVLLPVGVGLLLARLLLAGRTLLRLELALVFPKEEGVMQHSSVSISLTF